MLYPYLKLEDETEILHTHVLHDGEREYIEVHFEKPTEDGFCSARCRWPGYQWIFNNGYDDADIRFFEELILNSVKEMWQKVSDNSIKWSDVRKEMYAPEELIKADRLKELHRLYLGILELQEELSTQHHDAEIGCLDYKVIKALAATYELQDYLAGRIAQAESLGEE